MRLWPHLSVDSHSQVWCSRTCLLSGYYRGRWYLPHIWRILRLLFALPGVGSSLRGWGPIQFSHHFHGFPPGKGLFPHLAPHFPYLFSSFPKTSIPLKFHFQRDLHSLWRSAILPSFVVWDIWIRGGVVVPLHHYLFSHGGKRRESG